MEYESTFFASVDQACCRGFEDAWREGRPQPIEAHLPPLEAADYLATLEELVHIELEMGWKSGGAPLPASLAAALTTSAGEEPGQKGVAGPLVEAYLQRFPQLNRPEIILRLVRQEYRVRHMHGDKPGSQEYQLRFPDVVSTDPGIVVSRPPLREELPHIPGYEILALIGQGGMGVVYKARQISLKRLVALKMLPPGLTATPESLQRFRTEAEAVAQLHHPNIVHIHEIGEANGRPFFALEFIEGGSLDKLLAATPQPPILAAQVVETLARAIHVAHQQGIIHRDLKPANVLLQETNDRRKGAEDKGQQTRDDIQESEVGGQKTEEAVGPGHSPDYWHLAGGCTPKITDFGLAKRLQEGTGMTQTGDILGTPSYMAPEQALGKIKAIAACTDVYALGAILYEMLTGRPPFRAKTPMDTLWQVVHDDPVPPARFQPKIPLDLQTICLKCLEKIPQKRYATAWQLAEDLRCFLDHKPILARPTGILEQGVKWARRNPAAAALLSVGLLAVMVLLIMGTVFTLRLQDESRKLFEEANKTKAALDKLQTAMDQLQAESQAREEANRAKLQEQEQKEAALKLAVRQAQTALYVRNLNQAYQSWRRFELDGALAALAQCQESLRGWEWNYVQQLCRKSRLDCGKRNLLAFSKDGKRLALVGKSEVGREVEVRDAQSAAVLLLIKVNCLQINSITFSPDGRLLVFDQSGSWNKVNKDWSDHLVMIYDAAGGQKIAALPGHTKAITCAAFSPDGLLLATGSADQTVRLWDTHTWTAVNSLAGHTQAVRSLAFGKGGLTLASAGNDAAVILWDVKTGKAKQTLQDSPKAINTVAFSPDSQLLASAGKDCIIRIWDVATAQTTRLLLGHTKEITSLDFDQDGLRLASADAGGAIKIWNTADGQENLTFSEQKGTWVKFSPTKYHLAFAGPAAQVIDLSQKREISVVNTHPFQVKGIAFSPDGKYVAAGGREGNKSTVQIRDGRTGQTNFVLHGHERTGPVQGLAFSPDGNLLAASDFMVTCWDWKTQRPGHRLVAPGPRVKQVYDLAFIPKSTRLASAGADGILRVWDVQTGQAVYHRQADSKTVYAVAASPDGAYLASGGIDRQVNVWNTADGTLLTTFPTGSIILDAVFLPSGNRLAAATAAGSVIIWDILARKTLLTFKANSKSVESLACSPDGQRLATTSGWGGKNLRIWDSQTGQELLMLTPPMKFPQSVAFSSDGLRLAVGGDHGVANNGTIAIWDATPAPEAPKIKPIVSDHRQEKMQPFFDLFLAAHNQTKQPLTLHLRFMKRERKDTWFPPGKEYAQFTLQPGDKKNLVFQGQPITAFRIRYWVQTPSGEIILNRKQKEVRLLPPGGDLYVAPERQTHTITILPQKTK